EVKPDAVAEAEPEVVAEAEAEFEAVVVADVGAETASGEIEITVEELGAAYQTDKVAANERFTDKILRVSGSVDRVVVRDSLDIYYVLLNGVAKKALWNVRGTFNREEGASLRGLTKGQVVTVQGRCSGYERNILLKDCVVIS
ncbi:hypothetical protein ACFLXD_07055, partial [Chloroflexota bacterium]